MTTGIAMTDVEPAKSFNKALLVAAIDQAVRAVPPLWPLSTSVAVNPFLGQTSEPLAMVAARLARVADTTVTMPRSWYADKIKAGVILDEDLEAALLASSDPLAPASVDSFKAATAQNSPKANALPTIAELARGVSDVDWPSLLEERFGVWAASYFDEGQALWGASQGVGAYSIWRQTATRDLTPEIAGLRGFASFVAAMPDKTDEAIAIAVGQLQLDGPELPTYFHRILMTLGGWAQFGRFRLWQAELAGQTDHTLSDMLAIRLVWEAALYRQYRENMAVQWKSVRANHSLPPAANADQVLDVLLQEAFERSTQRALSASLAKPASIRAMARPALQAAFCIDVRSEVFRRALEGVNRDIQTLGFAGFFGLGTAHHSFASDINELRLPVLLNPTMHSSSVGMHNHGEDLARRYAARAKRAWGRFKLAAVSSFAFVEATGPVYAGKLLADALGVLRNKRKPEPTPHFAPSLPLEQRVRMATNVLRAMSLTQNFAPVVLVVGHGATVVNNPHASALHCGACGGYSGEVNARLLAGLLNDGEVRSGLDANGITVPADTLFIGALHDTTTDRLTLYDGDREDSADVERLVTVRRWLAEASQICAAERALKLPRAATASSVASRSRDWAETRPEWALAGCQAFIAAPRGRTLGKDLSGRAFLHDYNWRADESFSVLELIITAPVVVASWISLQYYGSTVSPGVFGGGNKLLHNVVGGIGVVEGNGGLLRAGLPWQSVHDGAKFIHDPVRLSVCLEAPVEAISAVLARHNGVRALFDNWWLHLFALDDQGRMAWRYDRDLRWVPAERSAATRSPGTLAA
jgi:uncharacterized protein YbcC (UPF0753/DUF2309 family)